MRFSIVLKGCATFKVEEFKGLNGHRVERVKKVIRYWLFGDSKGVGPFRLFDHFNLFDPFYRLSRIFKPL